MTFKAAAQNDCRTIASPEDRGANLPHGLRGACGMCLIASAHLFVIPFSQVWALDQVKKQRGEA